MLNSVVSTAGILFYGLILNGFLAVAAFSLRGRGRFEPASGECHEATAFIAGLLSFALSLFGLIVVLVTLLGSLGRLNSRPIVLSAVVLAAAVVRWLNRDREVSFREQMTAARNGMRALSAMNVPGRAGLLLMAAVAIPWLALFSAQVFQPPVAWDAITYHLMHPVHWLQSGHLSTLPQPFGEPGIPYFPVVVEMIYYWGFLSTGSDAWTVFAQVPAAALGALALAGVVVELGGGGRAGTFAALLWLSLPIVLRQSVEPMVDIWISFFFFSATFFLLRWWRNGRAGSPICAAAAAGLMAGTKYAGVLWLLPLLALGLVAIPSNLRRGYGRTRIAGLLGTCAIVALSLGGYSYLRNMVAGGNPFLPVEVTIGGCPIFHGTVSPENYFAMEIFDDAHRRFTAFRFLFAPRAILDIGPGLAILVAVPFVALVVSYLRRRGPRRRIRAIAIVALLLLALHVWVIPYKSNRYLLPFAGSAIALALPMVSDRFRKPLLVFPVFTIPLTLFYWAKELWWGGVRESHVLYLVLLAISVVVARGALPWPSGRSISRGTTGRRKGMWPRFMAAAALCFLAISVGQAIYQQQRYPNWIRFWSSRFEWEDRGTAREDLADAVMVWNAVADAAGEEPATVAFSGNNLLYPLTGKNLKNRVIFVPRNGRRQDTEFRWGSRPLDPVSGGSKELWLANLTALGVDMLCLYRLDARFDPERGYPIEMAWIESAPDRFEEIYDSNWARLYRIRPYGISAGNNSLRP